MAVRCVSTSPSLRDVEEDDEDEEDKDEDEDEDEDEEGESKSTKAAKAKAKAKAWAPGRMVSFHVPHLGTPLRTEYGTHFLNSGLGHDLPQCSLFWR